MDEDTLPTYADQCVNLAKGIEASLAATGNVCLDSSDWTMVLAALRGWSAPASGGSAVAVEEVRLDQIWEDLRQHGTTDAENIEAILHELKRHRLASASLERDQALEEAAKAADAEADGLHARSESKNFFHERAEGAALAASAIRALKTAPNDPASFLDRVLKLIQDEKETHKGTREPSEVGAVCALESLEDQVRALKDTKTTPGRVEDGEPARKLGFMQGMVMACTTIIRTFDQPTIAKEILGAACVTEAELLACGLDEYDVDACLPIVRELKPGTAPSSPPQQIGQQAEPQGGL